MDILELITLFHKGTERQGPGSDDTTRKAFSFVPPLPMDATILDLGSSTGASTVIGATKIAQLDDTVAAASVILSEEKIRFLEEPYVPHKVVGHV